MASQYLRKYGVATVIDFQLYKLDGSGLKSDAASATGDIKIMKDEGAEANTTADAFVDEGQGYSLALTATEMTAARVVIYIVDLSAPQVWLDKVLIIETYGHASAQHAFDLASATVNLSSASEAQIDAIETDTNEIQGKLPTNKIMGSSVVTDKDDEIDAIKVMTDKVGTITNTGGTATIGAILGDFANSALVTRVAAVKTDTAAIKAKTDLIGASVALESGGNLATIAGKLPTNYIMGSAVLTAKDDEIDAIKAITDLLTLAAINAEVDTALNTAVPTSNTANSINDLLLDQIDVTTDAVKAKTDLIGASVALESAGNLAAVKAKTDLIPADITTQLDTNVPAIKAKTDLIPADITTQLDTNVPAIKTMTDKIGTITNTGGTATIGAVLGDVANSAIAARLILIASYIDTEVAAIKAKTDLIGASVALESGGNLATIAGKLPTNYIMGSAVLTAKDDEIDAIKAITDLLTLAAINAEVDTALADVDLDHMVKTTIGAGKPTVGTLMDKVLNKSGSQTFDPTTDSLEAVRDNMAGADSAAIADAVWDEAVSGHTSGTTFGGTDAAIKAKTDLIGASVALENSGNLAAVKAKTDLIPADITTQLDTNVPAIKAKTDLIGASVALESAGNLAAVKAKTDTLPVSPANEATFTHATYGIDKIKTETAAIKAKTDLIGASVALESTGNLAAVKAKTDLIGASVALESGGNLATVLAESQSHPTLAEIEATTILAKEATFTHATYGIDKIKTETAAVKAKTDIIGASVALESGGNLATVLADTNELQTDWVNGGRLDLLIDLIITNLGTVDTVVDAIKAITDLLTLGAIADAVHDEVTEGTTTLRQSIRLIDSALFGKLSGGGTTTLVFRDIDDTKARITATVDANFNRTAVTKVAT
jgi:tetrahydromethanopterin S-methyltransferase subunit F